MEIIEVSYPHEIPKNFTGCVHYFYENRRLSSNKYLPDCLEYYLNGMIHKKDGPAVLYADGKRLWFLFGELKTAEEVFEAADEETQIEMIWNMDQWR